MVWTFLWGCLFSSSTRGFWSYWPCFWSFFEMGSFWNESSETQECSCLGYGRWLGCKELQVNQVQKRLVMAMAIDISKRRCFCSGALSFWTTAYGPRVNRWDAKSLTAKVSRLRPAPLSPLKPPPEEQECLGSHLKPPHIIKNPVFLYGHWCFPQQSMFCTPMKACERLGRFVQTENKFDFRVNEESMEEVFSKMFLGWWNPPCRGDPCFLDF